MIPKSCTLFSTLVHHPHPDSNNKLKTQTLKLLVCILLQFSIKVMYGCEWRLRQGMMILTSKPRTLKVTAGRSGSRDSLSKEVAYLSYPEHFSSALKEVKGGNKRNKKHTLKFSHENGPPKPAHQMLSALPWVIRQRLPTVLVHPEKSPCRIQVCSGHRLSIHHFFKKY